MWRIDLPAAPAPRGLAQEVSPRLARLGRSDFAFYRPDRALRWGCEVGGEGFEEGVGGAGFARLGFAGFHAGFEDVEDV